MQSHQPPPAPISVKRLFQLQGWVRRTLIWAAAIAIALAAPHHARAFVCRMRGYAGMLLIARAVLRMPMPRHGPRAHAHLLRATRAITKRRILGHRFRRALRARGLIAQARAVARVLANAETWIAAIMRRRLPRLALTEAPHTQTAPEPIAAIAACAYADSS
jgi:hypothetical protein